MLAGFEAWGVEQAVKRFNGMFAFALWDGQERALTLGRDRLGIKPLYWGEVNGTLLFGSELKCLQAHPAFRGQVDHGALTLFLRYSYIPGPYSIYTGIQKLPAGTLMTVRPGQGAAQAQVRPFWTARQMVEDGLQQPFEGSADEAVDALQELLQDAVRLRRIADVPLGAFLSGGVDSSTLVALLQAQSSRPVQTFTIGFQEGEYDEARQAKEVARHLGSRHTELYVTPEEARQVIPRLPQLYDEPFADVSQIPTFLVAQLARRHVTVALSGDGGDELFAGYNRYAWVERIWQRSGRLPGGVRRAAAALLEAVGPANWQRVGALSGQRLLGDKAAKLAGALRAGSPEEIYRGLVSSGGDPAGLVLGGYEPAHLLTERAAWPRTPDITRQMMALDLLSYLPEDGLVKVDRASMSVGLEVRVPFLDDHRVAELAWRLPLAYKLRAGQTKWVLRQVLYRYVPPALIERPKMGFAVPIESWLRGPLREWGEDLLSVERLRRQGFLQPEAVRARWQAHLGGQSGSTYLLWNVLMFQAWLDEYGEGGAA